VENIDDIWEEDGFKSEEDELFEHHKFIIDKGQEIIRIDKFLLDRLPNTSRNKIQVAAKNGNVLANKIVIKQNYKVKPVDYWEGMWQSDTSGQRTRESEDRVFSKTPSIPIAGIVKEIHQLVTDHDEFRSPVIRKLAIIAKVEGIPIYFYTNKESWLTQNPKDRVNISKISKSFKGQAKPGWTSRSRRITTLEQWIELIHKKDKKELTPEANKLRFNIVYYGSRYPDEDQGLSIELTNARKPGEPERKYAAKIIDYMRKYNLNTAGLKNAMVEKWSFPI
jgi:hypothetical protein